MLEKVEHALIRHQETVQLCSDTLQNYIYMASLLSYEAVLRGNRLFIYGEGQSYAIAAYMVARLKRKYPDLAIVLRKESEKDLQTFEREAAELDIFFAVGSNAESALLPRFIDIARQKECKSIGICASYNASFHSKSDVAVIVPSKEQARVDEVHLLICNIIADAIEDILKVA